jgi:hypothetical protein
MNNIINAQDRFGSAVLKGLPLRWWITRAPKIAVRAWRLYRSGMRCPA